ncbi:histidine kinase [Natronomonas moolapensis 8.8.11]|uniref:histidine kinase n=1 Tax=Natronomonas moolapensis (strain DSM 18674 / CECT 7526 / JCM 14361 / 8.8.11) TaxID=268739 RepID=M1Y002_NATM8|nr:GAF domain-containing sensor histidine kinase [Natronomonas moolapensis]CCQ35766.1 histidine kinase [Natronomonas moolapensis 8.8.11]
MDATDERVSVPRPIGAAAMSALGLALAAVHLNHIITGELPLSEMLFGGVFPLFLAAALAAGGPLLYRSRLDAAAITTTVAWGYIGGVALACVSLLVVAHQLAKGDPLHGSGYVVAVTATGGSLVGAVTGRYDALNRQKADYISSLQEATAALSGATTVDEVCSRAVEIANDVLEIPLTGIWLYDEDAEALRPATVADPAADAFETPPTYRPGNSLSWAAFESGEIKRYDDLSAHESRHNPDTIVCSEIVVPLGDVGVMNFGSTEPSRFDDLEETVAGLLGTATEAALVRADREQTLRTQRRRLERQNERLGEFTSVVSHDLRNPLSVAKGRIELAREDGDEAHLQAATDALDDMESLIDDLLDLAKQGRDVGETEPVSLAAVAEDAWKNIEVEGATLTMVDLTLEADADRLRQLLENLLRNAVVHAAPDPEIRVGPLPDEGFFVEDDGPGVPEADRERVFEVGYTDHDDGTGFGLPIVRRIADAHGWSVRLAEGSAGGVRFEFRFGGDRDESGDRPDRQRGGSRGFGAASGRRVGSVGRRLGRLPDDGTAGWR